MRMILIVMFFLPCCTFAQLNRSAKELANENVNEYLSEKIFKGHQYNARMEGEIDSCNSKDAPYSWKIKYAVDTVNAKTNSDSTGTFHQVFMFMFYLDDRMNVYTAESFTKH